MSALQPCKPAQVFAAMDGSKRSVKTDREKQPVPVIAMLPPPEELATVRKGDSGETMQVSASAEKAVTPDLCKFNICVTSKKDRAQDVKNSVSRRFDYVLQTLHNHRIKDSEMTVSENLHRVSEGGVEQFEMTSEVSVCTSDMGKYQAINNVLIEKLDKLVVVSLPDFSHKPDTLEQARREVALLAVKNCKAKAAEIAQAVSCRLGSVMGVREDSTEQWYEDSCSAAELSRDQHQPMTLQHRMTTATIHVAAKMTVTFELRSLVHKTKHQKS